MYLVDTNFIGELETIYPGDVFPTLWVQLEHRLFVPDVCFHEEVHTELRNWKHPRLNWYLNHVTPGQILASDREELDAYQAVSKWVVGKHQPPYKSSAVDAFLNVADSWIVASAHRHRATIVTNEKPAPESKRKIKIPDVAAQFNVPCINTLDFLRVLNVRI